jgi:protein TonB
MHAIPLAALALCLVTGSSTAASPQGAEGPVYKPGDGVSAPILVKEVKPQYTAKAKDARIQGTVLLECVVETDGRVGDVKVARSLDEDLDLEAVKAARQWRFEPGTKDGKAVRVQITLEMTFTLR